MKSIVYILLVALFCSNVVSAFPQLMTNQKQVVKIQSDKNSKPDLLNESCSIIKKRLKDYGLQNFDVYVKTDQKVIEITFNNKVDLNEILPLLTSKGKIEFYETYNRSDFIRLLEKGDKLFSILNVPSENSEINTSSAILGYCKQEDISQVDSYITRHYVNKPGQDINFVWSKNSDQKGDYYLYLLKHNPALDKSQILEAVESKMDENTDLMISFNERGTLAWQNTSKNNIGKSIAVVIDNFVYCDPLLKDEIKNGECVISGNYTLEEVIQLKSLINNDELPLEFKLIE